MMCRSAIICGPAEVASDAMPHIVHEFYDVRWIVAVVRHLAHVANVIVNKLLRQWVDVVVWLPDGERLNKIVHRCGSSAHDLSLSNNISTASSCASSSTGFSSSMIGTGSIAWMAVMVFDDMPASSMAFFTSSTDR
jgi:hypothetical protein